MSVEHIMSRAAIYTGVDRPLEVHDIEVAPPGPGEIRLRMAASGVCHSDLSIRNGTLPTAAPMILGHEGAGVVEAIGSGVDGFTPGDHVVVSWVPQCGECFYCSRRQGYLCERGADAMHAGSMLDGRHPARLGGEPLPQMCAVGTFAEVSVVPAIAAVPIPPTVDLRAAALIGCGVLTGAGAALNTANISRGDTVAVIGCGGVGLNVIQGAAMRDAGRVIAVDVVAAKLDLARQLGASDVVCADSGDPVQAVFDLTGGRGADVAFEVIGLRRTVDQAVAMTRRGGQTVLVGAAPADVMLEVPVFRGIVRYAKTITGCFYGSANVREDVPTLIGAYQAGRLDLDRLISRQIKLDDVNDAFDALGSGEVARSVIVY